MRGARDKLTNLVAINFVGDYQLTGFVSVVADDRIPRLGFRVEGFGFRVEG